MLTSKRRALLLVVVFTLAGLGAGQVTHGIRQGRAAGTWNLPNAIPEGAVRGTLVAFQGGAPPFALHATLFSSPCPGCVGGPVMGLLDDGLGAGPDYLVDGTYEGTNVAGVVRGTFDLQLSTPDGAPAGSMRGRFQDSLSSSTGSFLAHYTLRR